MNVLEHRNTIHEDYSNSLRGKGVHFLLMSILDVMAFGECNSHHEAHMANIL